MLDNLKTLIDVLYNSKKNFNEKAFIKYKENNIFKPVSYNKFAELIEHLAYSFLKIGIKKNSNVGIISENSYKWFLTDIALINIGAVDVPRGSDSTSQELSYILKHSEVKYCIVENAEQADKVLSNIINYPKLKNIILLYESVKEIKNKNKNKVKIYHFDDLLEKGKSLIKQYDKTLKSIQKSVKENDLVTIIYTSGTTGAPKGVMLTHKNIMHNIKNLPDMIDITENERWLSILPVWHVFERTIEYIILATGGLMAYSKANAKHLLPDFLEIKPTFMISVPRIWESLYQGVITKIKSESKLKFILFNFFLKLAVVYKKSWKVIKNLEPLFKKPFILLTIFKKIYSGFFILSLAFFYFIGDKLIFKTIRNKTGGCLRGPISGGGALPEYVDNFFNAVNVEILEGWGLTETAPVNGVRTFNRKVPKTVGPAAPGVQIMICDKKGKPLLNQHEKGIVFIKGDNVMKGYYKEPKKTKEVLSKDGWFNTGDLGRMTITGELQLTGRQKDTIVLTGGENIEPGPIEDKMLEHPLIQQIIVVGQDKKVLGALIVPHQDNLTEYAKKHNIHFENFDKLLINKEIIHEYKKIAKSKINSINGFKDYERITYISLLKEPFKAGVEMTHSLKLKRNFILEKYKTIIDKIYV